MTEEDKLFEHKLRNRALADYERLDLAIKELERQEKNIGDIQTELKPSYNSVTESEGE